MQRLISQPNKNRIELTGNPFIDTGLAVIAALNDCSTIEGLTLRKMRNVHGNGTKLARNNMRLKSNYMVFVNSISMNPAVKDRKVRAKNYAKITTAILNNIGHEEIHELCDFCGNQDSADLDKLFYQVFGDKKNNKKKKKKMEKNNKPAEHYIGRDWFPLAGSIGSDAQALPSGSRSLNICAKCLFAVQYLPQGVVLIKGLLAIFQSTTITFWYELVRDYAKAISNRLSAKGNKKIETIGKKEGNGVDLINRLLAIMKRGIRADPNTFLTIWLFSNHGNKADCQLDTIPNFSLNFLDKAAKSGLDMEITKLIVKDKSYHRSFLNCISKKLDYDKLYPSKKFRQEGASYELFLLYQTHIRNYRAETLYTAYKIARYVNSIDPEKNRDLGIDIDKDIRKQNAVKKRIIEMAKRGSITFDEYYDLFVVSHRGNPWQLVRYYMLSNNMLSNIANFNTIEGVVNDKLNNNQEYKNRVITIGTAIFNSYIKRRGRERLTRDVLGEMSHGRIHANWLRNQFKRLSEENEDFDYNTNWNALCINKQGEEYVYDVLYLLRFLFTTLLYHTTQQNI